MKGKVILLTGAPATGKSSLADSLIGMIPNLEKISFGQLLFQEKKKIIPSLTYEQLREQSATLITSDDVATLDKKLIEWVNNSRASRHIVIDSHAVTKEVYGFRVTPFNYSQVIELNLDAVISLYCEPQVIHQRFYENQKGRIMPTNFEMLMHGQLQDGIASLYGVLSGCPIYHIDSSKPLEQICQIVAETLFP